MKNTMSVLSLGLFLLTALTSCEHEKQPTFTPAPEHLNASPQHDDYSTITLYKKDLGEMTKEKNLKSYPKSYAGTTISLSYFKDCIALINSHFKYVPYNCVLEGPGITSANEAMLDELFAQQQYIDALKIIWSERSKQKRVDYLEKQAKNLHVIAMIELYKEIIKEAYFTQNSSMVKTALIWKCAALLRMGQDAKCCIDPSTYSTAENVFFMTLASTMSTQEKYDNCRQFEQGVYITDAKKLFSIARDIISDYSATKPYPSPQWIIHSNFFNIFQLQNATTDTITVDGVLPPDQWDVIRKHVLDESIENE